MVTPTSPNVAAIGACGLWTVTRTAVTSAKRARIACEDRIGDCAGRGLDQPIALGAERPARDLDDLVVADRVGQLVGMRGGREIDVKDEIELEGLSDFGLMLHHAVIGMQRKAGNEDGIGHRASRMAFATRSACTVSATSWVRTMAAPLSTATRWLTIEPPRR